MRFSIVIDQRRAVEWGLNLSQAATFAFCYELPSWAKEIIINDEVFYFASRTKALEEIPIVSEKADTIYRLFKILAEKKLIIWTKHEGKDCIKLTEKGKTWNSEKNPRLGKKSEKTRKIFRKSSEKNPTYNITIDKCTTDTLSAREKEKPKKPICEQSWNYWKEYFIKNPHFISGIKSAAPKFKGRISDLIKEYLLDMQGKGEFHFLGIPRNEEEAYHRAAIIQANVIKWANYRVNNPKKNGPQKPTYEPPPGGFYTPGPARPEPTGMNSMADIMKNKVNTPA